MDLPSGGSFFLCRLCSTLHYIFLSSPQAQRIIVETSHPHLGSSTFTPDLMTPHSSLESISDLPTPFALVDEEKMLRNLDLVAEYAARHSLTLRPHCKTHKDPAIARLQVQKGAIGVTCATAKEAEVMSQVVGDILVAYPPVDPERIRRLISLTRKTKLSVALDSQIAIERFERALVQAGADNPAPVDVLLEVDFGGAHTGVEPESAALVQLLTSLKACSRLRYAGILFHAGDLHVAPQALTPAGTLEPDTWQESRRFASQGEFDPPFIDAVAALNQRLNQLVSWLESLDAEPLVVSAGNTPTLFMNHLIDAVTEIRPGTYVYCDRDIATQNIFPFENVAYSILTTVISTAVAGQIVVDAGTKALAKEPLNHLKGLGVVLDDPSLVVVGTSEEHGMIDVSRSERTFKVGQRLQIVPNHVCVSVHLQEEVAFQTAQGDIKRRPVAARGR